MNAILKVNRLQLIAKLEDARDERMARKGQYELEIEEAIAEVKAGDTPEAFKTRMADWYNAVGEGIEAETITLDRRGAPRNAPPRPRQGEAVGHYKGYSMETLERERDRYAQQRKDAVRPLDTALELLAMDSRDEIEIDSADYHRLLSS